jgi:hypothetical protein
MSNHETKGAGTPEDPQEGLGTEFEGVPAGTSGSAAPGTEAAGNDEEPPAPKGD